MEGLRAALSPCALIFPCQNRAAHPSPWASVGEGSLQQTLEGVPVLG